MVRGRRNPRHFGLALRLRQARKQSGLKKTPLAERAGIAAATERDIESGARLPTVSTIARLAAALNVSAGWLAYDIGDACIASTAATTTTSMGARLQEVRTQRGLSKAALARLVGLSPTALANIENGAQSGVDVVETLAHVLGISPAWLAFGQQPEIVPERRRGRPPAQSSAPVS
jgi:transcriptional regulator with XRE-family HTH domain